MTKVYWANALFSDADRAFNTRCVELLRNAGYFVFLPQEATVNTTPSDESLLTQSIFCADTSELLSSDIVVACLDQETIDCGVACEIGIAVAKGLPVVGLYTDVRQFRHGRNSMYKNPYVVGAIELSGEIVTSVEQLVPALQRVQRRLETPVLVNNVSEHFGSVAALYRDFVCQLESWYTPSWSVNEIVERTLELRRPTRVLEIGCGDGRMGRHIAATMKHLFYVGYDVSSQMIGLAQGWSNSTNCLYTHSWNDVGFHSSYEPFDLGLLLFVLHDQLMPEDVVKSMVANIKQDGQITIVDLSKWDLPKLTALLTDELVGLPRRIDRRFDIVDLYSLAQSCKLRVLSCEVIPLLVQFPSAEAVLQYLNVYGILNGMDLPLHVKQVDRTSLEERAYAALKTQMYPLKDQRCFIHCELQILPLSQPGN